jgi:hypothetical protein
MSALTDCLQTDAPQILPFPDGLGPPPDPLAWALDLFAANLVQADMQRMESGPGEDLRIAYFDQNDPASFELFSQRLRHAQPVHGSLALIDWCAGYGTVRDNADWAAEVFGGQFAQGLAERHPLGSYLRSTLWTSCGEHLYQAHCDLADGFLFHMAGRKRVRVWPLPKKYRRKVIFNHSDFAGRMSSAPLAFELQPGEVLFIPAGAMHEVVAHGDQAAVSVSFHMGSPFPLLTLCAQLNGMLRGGEVSVPPHMRKTDKFNAYFFEPNRFVRQSDGPEDSMPEELLRELSGVLQSRQLDPVTLKRLLSNWWRLARSRPMYRGPYPEPA